MYSQHFGLTQDPFSIAPDPRYLFMSERHREALAHLLYGVGGSGRLAGGGFVLLTGDIGTGKTTICRCFLEQIPSGCHVAYIFNPKLTVPELLQSICQEFHIAVALASGAVPTAKDYIDALNTFLLQSHAAGQSNVLIIDEAQNLQSEVLEQLRLLTNLETNERKLLQIVLIGQPELRVMLARPELEQLAQRVIARFHLDALDATESAHYIAHRLAVAGHKGALPFDTRAMRRIHALTRGVPRRINLLCGRALLGAWANGMQRVNSAVVNKAASEVFGPDASAAPGGIGSPWTTFLGGVLLTVAALAGFLLWSSNQESASLVTVAPAASAPKSSQEAVAVAPLSAASGAASTTISVDKPVDKVAKEEALDLLLPQLPQDFVSAWRGLAPVWGLGLTEGDPCQSAALQPLQCYRANDLTLPQLRRLGRPGILTLQAGNAPPVYAVLTGLSEQRATLHIGATPHVVTLAALSRIWRGDFATFWHPPPGYVPNLQVGSRGAAIDALARQLDSLDGVTEVTTSAAPRTLDSALRLRVLAFQRAQGLKADGQPGPLTFMQMEVASGTMTPLLTTNP
jgi:general secretion pathway protein A